LTSENNRNVEKLADADESWWAARLEKPIDSEVLLATVEQAIAICEKQHRTVPERIRDVFLERSRERVERIAGALREGRTPERSGAGLGSAVEYVAQLRGAALAFGYDKVAAIASEIEERLDGGAATMMPSTPDVNRLRLAVSELEDADFEDTTDQSVDVEEDLASALQVVAGSNANSPALRVLFVHDDTALAERVQAAAAHHEVRATLAPDAPTAFDLAARRTFDAFVVALRSDDANLNMISQLTDLAPNTPAVMRGGDDTTLYQKAVRSGAAGIAPHLADADELLRAASAAHLATAARGNARVLVLGGDADVRRIAREQLSTEVGTVEFEPDDTDLVRDLARHEPDILVVTLGADAPETIERLQALRIATSRRLIPILAVTEPGIALMSSEMPAGIVDATITLSEARDCLARVITEMLDRARARNEMFRIDTATGALPREAFLRLVDDEISARREDQDSAVTVATLRLDYDRIAARSGRDAAESAVAIAAAHLRSSMRVAGEFIGRLGPGCVAAMRRSSDEEQVRAQTRNALRAAQIGMAFGTAAPSRTDCELRLGVAVCAPAAGVRQAIAESLRSSEIIDARIAGPRVHRATRPDSASLPRKSYSIQRHSSFRRA